MGNKLSIDGLDELARQLLALPDELQREADPILQGKAEGAKTALVAAYPEVTGRLRAGVKVVPRKAGGQRKAAIHTLVSEAEYARVYEFGSARGQRPRATFLPISEAARRDSVVAVSNLVASKGLDVRGDRD